MSGHYIRGPGGKREVRDPLSIRLVQNSWFLTLWTLGFLLWGGYYLAVASPGVFLGQSLSTSHANLKTDCMVCHVPFSGVPNESCAAAGCHAKSYLNTIHNTMDKPCITCHAEHAEGAFLSRGVDEKDCAACHRRLKRDPKSIFHPDRLKKRKTSYVDRQIFQHSDHRFPPHYKCWQCHCTGAGTLNVPMERLFKMDTCVKCHEEGDCNDCHRYHDKRKKRPSQIQCIKEDYVGELLFKTATCTSFRGKAPGYENLTVCETGEPASEYGKEPPPERDVQDGNDPDQGSKEEGEE